ncbi:MAG: sensor N-terminal transmembrane domain-containing protein [Firmicutes bacterium]|nr:sensor N-terminal transmembrane domain-containing protein [Bacillota bacterium]
MRFKLGLQLTAVFLLITFLVVGTAGYLFFNTFRRRLIDERSMAQLTQTNIIASGVAPLIGEDQVEARQILRTRSREVGARLVFLDPRGRVALDASAGMAERHLEGERLDHPLVESALAGGQETSVQFLDGVGWTMYSTVPVIRRGEIIGVLFVSEGIDDIVAALVDLSRQLAFYLGASGIIVMLATIGIGQYLTAPLGRLTRAAERLGAGNLAERVDIRRRNEVGRLGEAFNRMAAQLEQVDRSRRRFIGDASHEMRTPLGTAKIVLESLLAQQTHDPETRRALQTIEEGVDRLAGLVNSLLVLTRLEHAKASGSEERWQDIDLRELAHQVSADCRPLADEKALRLEVNAANLVEVHGDEDALYRAVRNLVENAIRYTPRDGRVEVAVGRVGARAFLQVRDTGNGIAPEDLPYIFERFYRPDDARSRQAGGFGLGLAIVSEAVELHGGRIDVSSKPDEGTVMTIELPAADVE